MKSDPEDRGHEKMKIIKVVYRVIMFGAPANILFSALRRMGFA